MLLQQKRAGVKQDEGGQKDHEPVVGGLGEDHAVELLQDRIPEGEQDVLDHDRGELVVDVGRLSEWHLTVFVRDESEKFRSFEPPAALDGAGGRPEVEHSAEKFMVFVVLLIRSTKQRSLGLMDSSSKKELGREINFLTLLVLFAA